MDFLDEIISEQTVKQGNHDLGRRVDGDGGLVRTICSTINTKVTTEIKTKGT